MQNFIFTERMEPEKRLVGERVKDFGEIYEAFSPVEASGQSERCIQCGDPFCLTKCPLHNYIPQWLKSVAEKDLDLHLNFLMNHHHFQKLWDVFVLMMFFVKVTVL